MNNKHKAVWAVVALLIVLLGIFAWRFFNPTPRAVAPGDQTATTTPPFVDEPQHIVDNGRFYEIDAAYPGVTPLRTSAGEEADAAAVAAMKGFAENTIVAFKENNGLFGMTEEEFRQLTFGRDAKYAMGIEYKYYASARTLSYVYSIYQDTMGAHPNTYYRTFTFDADTGEAIHLDDLFVPGAPYLDRLSAITRRELPIIMGKMAEVPPEDIDKEYINSGTLPISDSFGNFAIDNDTLLMIFPPYQVGPYVYGTITVPIPLSELSSILSAEYRP